MVKKVTRDIKPKYQRMLWGMAAGRCEFPGCNEQLWKSSVTQETVNKAQKAHIYSFSENGPRGNKGIAADEVNDLSNLILVCHQCHQKIDQDKDGVRYPAELLRAWKAEHERRVEITTGIRPDKHSHVLLYGANIGLHSSPLSFQLAAEAMFPLRFPADDRPIELGMVNSSAHDHDAEFWRVEETHLVRRFGQRVRERLTQGDINHLSVFGLAPQPLLIRLGSLLNDIPASDVYQLHREPQDWRWREHPEDFRFITHEPETTDGPPAMVLSLSATIHKDRVTKVLGANPVIWEVTVNEPHNDFLVSRQQLSEYRRLMRRLMDRIKTKHGQDAVLHIFPTAPVSVAIETGRIRMPKSDLAWRIYDQVNRLGGFVRSLDIT